MHRVARADLQHQAVVDADCVRPGAQAGLLGSHKQLLNEGWAQALPNGVKE